MNGKNRCCGLTCDTEGCKNTYTPYLSDDGVLACVTHGDN